MDKYEIYRLIKNSEELCRRRRQKRYIYTILFYTAVNLLVLLWQGQIGRNIGDMLGEVLVAVIISVITFVANSIIWYQLFKLDQEDNEKHEMIKSKLEAIEQKKSDSY